MAAKLPILIPLKTCVPEKVGDTTPFGVKSGQCNGTPKKKEGLKVVVFLATFTILHTGNRLKVTIPVKNIFLDQEK